MKKTILIICVAAACILFGLVAFIGLSGRNKNEEQQYRNETERRKIYSGEGNNRSDAAQFFRESE